MITRIFLLSAVLILLASCQSKPIQLRALEKTIPFKDASLFPGHSKPVKYQLRLISTMMTIRKACSLPAWRMKVTGRYS